MARRKQESLFAEWDAEQEQLKKEKEEDEKRNWKLDSELSSATLTIRPVELDDGSVVYHLSTAVEVRPYPNPISFGGSWGGGTVESEAEAKEAEKLFLETLSTWSIMNMGHLKERGMTRIEVVWEEKMTITRSRNDKRADRGEEQPLLLV